MAPSWHRGGTVGTVVAPSWHHHGTLVAPSRHPDPAGTWRGQIGHRGPTANFPRILTRLRAAAAAACYNSRVGWAWGLSPWEDDELPDRLSALPFLVIPLGTSLFHWPKIVK